MTLGEILISFKNCTGESPYSFKEHLLKHYHDKIDDEPIVITNCYNYILSDVEKLLTKSMINLIAADITLQKGLYSWSYVGSYYSSFFIFQAINRIYLDFSVYLDSSYNCRYTDYVNQTLTLTRGNQNSPHQKEYEGYKKKLAFMRLISSPDRYWNFACQKFPMGDEVNWRNEINYSIQDNYYDELSLTSEKLEKIASQLTLNPFDNRLKERDAIEVTHHSVKSSASRIRSVVHILNHIANYSALYKSYFQKNIKNRNNQFNELFNDHTSDWLKTYFTNVLQFKEEEYLKEDEL